MASVITPDVDDSLYLGYKKNLVASGIDITPRLGFTLTIVPEDGLTHVIMIWPIIYDAIVQPYRDCLLSSNNFKVEKLLNKCVFCLSENWCMNPDAWEGLPQSVKDDLQQKLSMESYSDRARSVHRILTL